MNLPMVELIKLAKMAGVMHEADQSTWSLHRLATNVPLIACVINLPCAFTQYLDLSYFSILTICLLLLEIVSTAGCHCFDLISTV